MKVIFVFVFRVLAFLVQFYYASMYLPVHLISYVTECDISQFVCPQTMFPVAVTILIQLEDVLFLPNHSQKSRYVLEDRS